MAAGLQVQARALGDPTRHRLFRYIAEAQAPVTVAELTGYAGLNHNAVRQHLAVLTGAGLVTEETERRDRPGRPRLLYRLDPEAAGEWGTPGAYAWLAGLLTAALRNGQDPRQAGRQEGHRRAAEMAGPGDPAGLLEQEIARRGFRPARTDRGTRIEFTLGRCPFAEVAAADPGTICQLHLGLAEGLSEGLGGLATQRLAARPARRAGCRLTVRRTAPGSDPGMRQAGRGRATLRRRKNTMTSDRPLPRPGELPAAPRPAPAVILTYKLSFLLKLGDPAQTAAPRPATRRRPGAILVPQAADDRLRRSAEGQHAHDGCPAARDRLRPGLRPGLTRHAGIHPAPPVDEACEDFLLYN